MQGVWGGIILSQWIALDPGRGVVMRAAMNKRRKRVVPSGAIWRVWKNKTFGSPKWVLVWVSRHAAVLTRRSRLGLPTRTLLVPLPSTGVRAQVEALWAAREVLMKRRARPGVGAPIPPHADYADLLEGSPLFAEWMTDATFEDGSPRAGGWVSVYCRSGQWIATLRDNAEGLVLVLTAPTWTVLWSLVEHAIADPSAPWRPDTDRQGKVKSQKK